MNKIQASAAKSGGVNGFSGYRNMGAICSEIM